LSWAPKDKVPVNILYLNTLHREEDKHSFIAVIAQETYRWMLKNPSRKVQLIFFIDELAGLVPPHPYNPPTKKYIQLLMKQARKYGVSMMLATQNISDVDYKSLAQVSTWFLGRMMTQQDLGKVKQIIESISPTEVEHIIQQLPKLSVGKFMLLSPDNFDSVQPMKVRWLVTDHRTLDDTEVKEIMDRSGYRKLFEKFEPSEKEKDSIAKSTVIDSHNIIVDEEQPEEETKKIEKGNINQIIKQLEKRPEALSIEEIAELSNTSKNKVQSTIKELVKQGKLAQAKYKGKTVYYNPKFKLDPENYIVGQVYRFPLKYTLTKAKSYIKKEGMKRILGVVSEKIVEQPTLYYVPFWRIPVFRETRKGPVVFKAIGIGKKVKERIYVYVNALTGEVYIMDDGKFKPVVEEVNLSKINTPPKKEIKFEKMLKGTIRGKDLLPRMSREEAVEQVRLILAPEIADDENPALVYLPLWEFHLQDKQIPDEERYLWMDGYIGTIFTDDITAQARFEQDNS